MGRAGFGTGSAASSSADPLAALQPSAAMSQVPYAESSAWQRSFHSPYFNASHMRLRTVMRAFFNTHVPTAYAEAMEESGEQPPLELFRKMGEAGILAARIGPGEHMNLPGVPRLNDIPPDQFDYFHELIVHEEIARIGTPGACFVWVCWVRVIARCLVHPASSLPSLTYGIRNVYFS
jgi:alkylation response protein AidB-like acyl-CoA dehydrogenase